MDYKLLTKVLALQLMEPIHSLMHPNQARFILKRSIFNHIRLAKDYADVMEENNTIVALYQKKTYDKILKTWEDNGWIGVENTQLFKRAAYLL